MRRFHHALELARSQSQSLSSLIAPRLVHGFRPTGLFVLLFAVTAGVDQPSRAVWRGLRVQAEACAEGQVTLNPHIAH